MFLYCTRKPLRNEHKFTLKRFLIITSSLTNVQVKSHIHIPHSERFLHFCLLLVVVNFCAKFIFVDRYIMVLDKFIIP